MTSRRLFLASALGFLAAPAIVRASSLMPVKSMPLRWDAALDARALFHPALLSEHREFVVDMAINRDVTALFTVHRTGKAILPMSVRVVRITPAEA